jgi:hypothetical protein
MKKTVRFSDGRVVVVQRVKTKAGIHPATDCQIVTSTDQTLLNPSLPPEDPCPTITPADWANLKEAAREVRIPDRLFVEILERITGIPISQFRAGSLTYDQWAEILIQIEEAAFNLQVCCALEERPDAQGS